MSCHQDLGQEKEANTKVCKSIKLHNVQVSMIILGDEDVQLVDKALIKIKDRFYITIRASSTCNVSGIR